MVRLLLTEAVRLPEVGERVRARHADSAAGESATPEDVLLGFWFPVRTPPTDGRRDDDGDRSPLVVTVLPLAS